MRSEQVRTNQGGSVASFLIVGIVLVGLVAGGLYVLHRHGEEPAPKEPVATTSNKPASSPKPATSSPATSSPAPSKSSTPKPQKTPAATPISPLPKTGPSDNLAGGFAFAILLGVTVAYVQSRRTRLATVYNR